MAKAQFHKNQRVYVKPVGTWALIEHVVPHWAKGIDEPIRIHYDVGLGREFAAEELLSEEPLGDRSNQPRGNWRVVRARNKWQPAEDCARHPVPGTYPVVITGDTEWGGWRVPGAEYDLDPLKIEEQARLIADLGPHNAMILRNHGLLVCAPSIAQAFNLMYQLEMACRAQVDAMAGGIGQIRIPSEEVLARSAHLYQPGTRRPYGELEWHAMLRWLEAEPGGFPRHDR